MMMMMIIIMKAEWFIYNAIKNLGWKGEQDLKGGDNRDKNNAELESSWMTPKGIFLV
jgi:hypothetical protein